MFWWDMGWKEEEEVVEVLEGVCNMIDIVGVIVLRIIEEEC